MLIGALTTGNISDWLGRRPMLVAGVTPSPTATAWSAPPRSPLWPRAQRALKAHLPLGVTYALVAITGVWLFSAQVMVYATADTAYRESERAAGLGLVTGVGRTGAVVTADA